MSGKPDNRRRLSDRMERRRTELGLTWKQVAEAGEISYEAIRAVRHGDADIRALTKHGIDTGLQWVPGSVQAILDGREPATVVAGHAPAAPTPSPLEGMSADELTQFEEFVASKLTDELEQQIWRLRHYPPSRRIEMIKALQEARGEPRQERNTGSATTALSLG